MFNSWEINDFLFVAGLDVFARKRLYVLSMDSNTTPPEATMKKKIIGTTTTCDSSEHPYLAGYTVKIIAVLKNAARDDIDPDGPDYDNITDDEDLARAGGVTADDRIEVQPWLEKEGRYSFVSSDPRALDLACFAKLAKKGATR